MSEKPDSEEFNAKQARYDRPSGWIQLTRYETVRLLVDALLEAPPGYQFNKSELERRTGLSREAIGQHIQFLVELGVVNERDDGEWAEYELNSDGKVTRELFELTSAVNSVLHGEPKDVKTIPKVDPSNTEVDSKRAESPPEMFELIDNSNRSGQEDELVTQPPEGLQFANAD